MYGFSLSKSLALYLVSFHYTYRVSIFKSFFLDFTKVEEINEDI